MSQLRNPTRLLFVALPFLLLFLAACGAVKLAPTFSHQGRLLDENGAPVPDGNYEIEYGIFHAATGGTAVYTETQTIAVADGLFTASVSPFGTADPTVFAQPTWLQITVGGETLTPRQRLQGSLCSFPRLRRGRAKARKRATGFRRSGGHR
ncbi:MAG: hypothetical protein IPM60_15405 [Rhodospirillales bacterium]|nr:hypothetical protein [Rhodospirillales bacterium]